MLRQFIITTITIISATVLFAQNKKVIREGISKNVDYYLNNPDSIPPVGIIKGLSDGQLLETVQKQTFRFFWHGAHPVSGLALERSNTVLAEH